MRELCYVIWILNGKKSKESDASMSKRIQPTNKNQVQKTQNNFFRQVLSLFSLFRLENRLKDVKWFAYSHVEKTGIQA